ncbi:MAG: GNAT family N-acetyltransferase [Anaerolineae bacterium]|nr:GNAT family N-acetyltransferase [Anaerolineae bacterium]
MDEIRLTGYTPGAMGRIIELHGAYYARYWDLGLYFETKVATELAAFMSRFDAAHDGAWFAHVGERIVGGIFIDGSRVADEGARLRWFILDEAYQGLGLGARLMDAAMDFCRRQGFRRVYLTTFAGLTAARHLYEKHGFTQYDEIDGTELTGNPALTEQFLEWVMPDA